MKPFLRNGAITIIALQNLVNVPLSKTQPPGHAMDHWMQLRHTAWDNHRATQVLRITAVQIIHVHCQDESDTQFGKWRNE